MPATNKDAEAKLAVLSKRLRQGWAKRRPIAEKSLEPGRDALRHQWEREQLVKRRNPPSPKPARDNKRQPPGSDLGR